MLELRAHQERQRGQARVRDAKSEIASVVDVLATVTAPIGRFDFATDEATRNLAHRRHSGLGYRSPNGFENLHPAAAAAA